MTSWLLSLPSIIPFDILRNVAPLFLSPIFIFSFFSWCVHNVAGADPGEVKWVNFHSPFLSRLLSFFFLSLRYWSNIWFLWHYYKNSPPISKSWIRPCRMRKKWQHWMFKSIYLVNNRYIERPWMSSPNFHTNSYISATVHHTNPYITLGWLVGLVVRRELRKFQTNFANHLSKVLWNAL